MTPAEIEAEAARLREAFDARLLRVGDESATAAEDAAWTAVAMASLRAREEQVAILRDEVRKALAWHATPGGMRPNGPPELAGCPPSALRAILRMLPKETP